MSIHNRPDPLLATRDLILQPPPLTDEALYGIDFSRGKVNLLQFLRVDEGHLGQGKRVDFITFG